MYGYRNYLTLDGRGECAFCYCLPCLIKVDFTYGKIQVQTKVSLFLTLSTPVVYILLHLQTILQRLF